MSGARSHYQAMGVSRAASAAEIRDAYHRLARTLHPDRFMDASPAERSLADRRMREVNAAWAVLGRPDRRRAYDESLRPPEPSPRPSPGPSAQSASAPSSTTAGGAARPPRFDDDEATWDRWRDVDPEDDVELSRAVAFLLRRGPIIVLVFIAVGLFVGTAYASGQRDRERLEQQGPTTTWCAPVVAGGTC